MVYCTRRLISSDPQAAARAALLGTPQQWGAPDSAVRTARGDSLADRRDKYGRQHGRHRAPSPQHQHQQPTYPQQPAYQQQPVYQQQPAYQPPSPPPPAEEPQPQRRPSGEREDDALARLLAIELPAAAIDRIDRAAGRAAERPNRVTEAIEATMPAAR